MQYRNEIMMPSTDPRPTPDTAVPPWPPVSVVMPVLNEERHLTEVVQRALDQDYPGDVEVVLAVGPSRDRTAEVARELAAADSRVRVVDNPTGATPAALNAGLAVSSCAIVARVDGHALIPPDYLRLAVQTLTETGADNVGGIMAAEGVTTVERAVACAMTSPLGVGAARFHTGGVAGPADTVYLGVFRRAALERVGGFDESFLRAQDWEMNHRIRSSGGVVWFQPRMRVSYRPRGSLRALAKQYFNYGRWRRVVSRQHKGTINLRYLAPPTAVSAMAGGIVLACVGAAFGWMPALVGLAVPACYVVGVFAGAVWTGNGLPPRAWFMLPAVYAVMHCAWGAGFLTSPRRLVPDDQRPQVHP